MQHTFTSLGRQISLLELLHHGNLPLHWWGMSSKWKVTCNTNCPPGGFMPHQRLFQSFCFPSHSGRVVRLTISWTAARTVSVQVSLFGPSFVRCEMCSQWVTAVSNQYYSTIRSVVVLAATNERNVSQTQWAGVFFFRCSAQAQTLREEEINIHCINGEERHGCQGTTRQIMRRFRKMLIYRSARCTGSVNC